MQVCKAASTQKDRTKSKLSTSMLLLPVNKMSCGKKPNVILGYLKLRG